MVPHLKRHKTCLLLWVWTLKEVYCFSQSYIQPWFLCFLWRTLRNAESDGQNETDRVLMKVLLRYFFFFSPQEDTGADHCNSLHSKHSIPSVLRFWDSKDPLPGPALFVQQAHECYSPAPHTLLAHLRFQPYPADPRDLGTLEGQGVLQVHFLALLDGLVTLNGGKQSSVSLKYAILTNLHSALRCVIPRRPWWPSGPVSPWPELPLCPFWPFAPLWKNILLRFMLLCIVLKIQIQEDILYLYFPPLLSVLLHLLHPEALWLL